MQNQKKLTLKMTGVTPEELTGLHKSIRQSCLLALPARVNELQPNCSHERYNFARILSSVFNPETDSYSVEVEVDAAIKCWIERRDKRDSQLLLAPRLILDYILASFTGLFPEQATLLPQSKNN